MTTHGGAVGDTKSVEQTLPAAGEAIAEQIAEPTRDGKFKVNAKGVQELVADKGYHSGDVLVAYSVWLTIVLRHAIDNNAHLGSVLVLSIVPPLVVVLLWRRSEKWRAKRP